MKLTDWAQAVNARLAVFFNHREASWSARIDNAEFKKSELDKMLSTLGGYGATPDAALAELCKTVSGKIMITDALHPERRRELVVPQLEHLP